MVNLKKELYSEVHDLKRIWQRITRRDFSGNTGIAIKNSFFQILTNLTTKVGSLIFTVLLARILMPELYGNYALALSTILIFAAFSDLGLGETLIRFVSKELGLRNLNKAGAYIKYFSKIKTGLVLAVSLILITTSNFIANNYYHKPISLALMAGGFYILFVGFIALIQSIFRSYNLFKSIFFRETIFQIVRTISIPLLVIYFLKISMSNEKVLFWIIAILAFTYLLSSLSFFFHRKTGLRESLKDATFINNHEKKQINKFLLLMSATALSGVFFGYIDTIMLGHYVSSEYIAFYTVAFSFIGSIVPLISFSVTALLPTFSRISNEELNSLFKRSFKVISLLSTFIVILLLILSPLIIKLVVGPEYALSANILRAFSILLVLLPLIGLYSTYFTAVGKPGAVTRSLIISTIINIILNFVLISYLLKYGEIYSVYGATIATILSRIYYFLALARSKQKLRKN